MCVLVDLIGRDYTVVTSDNSRWARTKEHDSLIIDKQNDLFFWNSRKLYGGPVDYLVKVKGYSFHDAKDYLNRCPIINLVNVIQEPTEDVPATEELVNLFWKNGRKNREYWYKRLLTDDTIDRFKLGYYDEWFTLPLYDDNGIFFNFQLRRDIPEKRIKSWYHGKHQVLINKDILKFTSTCYITEGPVDALLLNQLGYPAISHNGGSGYWNEKWFKYFMKQKRIYILYDNDDAGRKGAKKVANNLGSYRCKIYTYSNYGDRYDSVDFFRDGNTKELFDYLIENESKFNFEI